MKIRNIAFLTICIFQMMFINYLFIDLVLVSVLRFRVCVRHVHTMNVYFASSEVPEVPRHERGRECEARDTILVQEVCSTCFTLCEGMFMGVIKHTHTHTVSQQHNL